MSTPTDLSTLALSMEVVGNGGTRRAPVQPRSQHTLKKVVDAASSLLAQVPLEEITTTRIATEAGMSIGSLYRFFPDKQSIIDAVAVRHVGEFRRMLEREVIPKLEREMADLSDFQPGKLLDLVVDYYVGLPRRQSRFSRDLVWTPH